MQHCGDKSVCRSYRQCGIGIKGDEIPRARDKFAILRHSRKTAGIASAKAYQLEHSASFSLPSAPSAVGCLPAAAYKKKKTLAVFIAQFPYFALGIFKYLFVPVFMLAVAVGQIGKQRKAKVFVPISEIIALKTIKQFAVAFLSEQQ